MIKNFDEYDLITEGSKKSNLSLIAAGLFALLFYIHGDYPFRMDKQIFSEYLISHNISNSDFRYREVLSNVKRKVMMDQKITNKQEVINTLDSLIVLYHTGNEITTEICRLVEKSNKIKFGRSYTTKAFVLGNSLLMMEPNSTNETIYHELMHIIDNVANKNKVDLSKFFNFTYNLNNQKTIMKSLTNGIFTIKGDGINQILISKYLSTPEEIYVRINSLKYFLYKHHFLKTPYEDLNYEIIHKLFNGEVYRSLNQNDQNIFSSSDFIELLLFIDFNKIMEINKYVQSKQNLNKTIT